MTFNTKNFSKATFKAQITRKQNQFNRFCKRYQTSKNPVEKSFLKTEAAYIVEDLKACAKQWMSCGFGPCGWVTRNFTMSVFNSMTPTTRKTTRKVTRKFGSKTTSRKRNAKRGYARRSNKTKSYARRTRKGSYARRSNARKSSVRRSYVAW